MSRRDALRKENIELAGVGHRHAEFWLHISEGGAPEDWELKSESVWFPITHEWLPTVYADADRIQVRRVLKKDNLRKEILSAINKHSVENDSNTPDFILAQYLMDCLSAFEKANLRREEWYGR
jgi:hypothetical protein